MDITPLDAWIKTKIGLGSDSPLVLSDLRQYQLDRIHWVLDYTRQNSPFYRDLLTGIPKPADLGDLSVLPFTTAEDLQAHHLDMLCVSQGDISRVVTLKTSGTTGRPKRIFFTEADLDLTTDFFHRGMSTLVRPGWRVLILMPGPAPGSIGDLLVKGLRRMNVKGYVHGPVTDPERVIDEIREKDIDALVAIPIQVLNLVRHPRGREPAKSIKSVLLSTDYVPRTVVDELYQAWHCQVYEHYGMTEMGYGGGVQCRARHGYHLREADIYFEVVDPDTGRILADGETGEVVMTTLTRLGMPLIRYRTGDLSRFLLESCHCGTVLRRLDKIQGRLDSVVSLDDNRLEMSRLDEAILRQPGILDYTCEIERRESHDHLIIQFRTALHQTVDFMGLKGAVENIPAVKKGLLADELEVTLVPAEPQATPRSSAAKRRIKDHRYTDE